MAALTRLEHELAGVVTLEDLAGGVIDQLQHLTEASGAFAFVFERPLVARAFGGSLAPALQHYTTEHFREDMVQAACLAHPRTTYLTPDEGDWDAHARSEVYAQFYRRFQVGFLKGVWPAEMKYGESGMFAFVLAKPTLSERFDDRAHRLLRHLELPLKAAARRIKRLGDITQERDVLRQLLGARRGAFALWDPQLRLTWVSPEAEASLADVFVRADLQALAATATRQLKRAKSAPERCVLGRTHELTAATGEPVRVQFCQLRGPDQRPWLLAELSVGGHIHEKLRALTTAEQRVLRLLMRGASNREICRELFVSNETVKTHVSRILRKLGVSSRSKAGSLARDAWLESGRGTPNEGG
jgi:DNA-binding CsgD family transcriptional regulator